MKITKKSNNTYCIFCKRVLDGGELFCEIDVPLVDCLKSGSKLEGKRFIHQIHLSCGYRYLKKLKNPSQGDKKLIREIENKYLKELIIDNLN